MGKYQTLAKNTGLVFIGTIGSKLINVIMLPLYTRWLVPDDFGAVDTMNTYALFIVGFVCLCLPDAIFIFPRNVDDKKKSEYFTSGLLFSLLTLAASALLFFAVSSVMTHYGQTNVFAKYPWFIYGLMFTTYIQNYTQSFTRSLDEMLHYSVAGMVLTFSVAAFSILMIPKMGLSGYALSLMAANLVAASYSFFAAKCYKYVSLPSATVGSVKEMLAYSAPLLPNGIMWWLVNGLNRPVMEHFLGLFAIGLYAVANKFSGLVYSMLSILSLAWNNSVLDEYGKPGFDRFYNNYVKMLTVALFLGGMVICALSRPLVQILTTPEYYEAYKYVPVLTLGVIFSGISGTVGGIFSAIKKSKYFFYSSVWGGVASVVALFALTPLFGLMGASISVVVSFFCMMIARMIYAKPYARIENIGFYVWLLVIYLTMVVVEIKIEDWWHYLLYLIPLVFVIIKSREEIKQVVNMVLTKFIKK